LSQANGIIYKNQKVLGDSSERLDEQFAVLTRLTVKKLNEIVTALNMSVGQDLVNPVSYEEQNAGFVEWAEFQKRPDWREHTRIWFTGGDLSELPPPPEPEVKEEPDTREDVEPFGGDYDGNSDLGDSATAEGKPQGDEDGEADAVPLLQDDDVPEGASQSR